MLSAGDDFPLHQTPEPVAFAGTDRNFYDRYFFNAQAPDGSAMLGVALGVYPHLDIIDCAVSVMADGEQSSLFASRILGGERMDTSVGPVTLTVEQPLHRLRVSVAENATGIAGDMLFTGLAPPQAEPRFTRRTGTRTLMDVTRMTQGGQWSGWVGVAGARHDLSGWRGVRDRSWGVRPIGAADAQPLVPPQLPQFFWIWAPTLFERWLLLFHTNDDAAGRPWNRAGVLVPLDGSAARPLVDPRLAIAWRAGSRRAGAARLEAVLEDGTPVAVEWRLGADFLMRGLGYGHPTRGHGMFQGADVLAAEGWRSDEVDVTQPGNAHVQAMSQATLTIGDDVALTGRGIFEQLAIGPHAPSGFRELFDLAG